MKVFEKAWIGAATTMVALITLFGPVGSSFDFSNPPAKPNPSSLTREQCERLGGDLLVAAKTGRPYCFDIEA